MNIVGQTVRLRAIERDDLPLLQSWANDPDIQFNLGSWHFPLSAADRNRWFDAFRGDSVDQRFIIDTDDHGPVGTTNLVSINWKDRNAFTGILIGDLTMRGRGYGKDAVRTLMRYAFEELALERLDTTIIAHNDASLKLYTGQCGWTEEGRKVRAFFRRNQFWDNVILGITRDQYRSLKEGGQLD